MHQVRINIAGKAQNAPGWHWDTRKAGWKDFDIWYVLEGGGRMETPRGVYEFHPGDCFVLRGDETYVGRSGGGKPVANYYVHYDYLDQADAVTRPLDADLPGFHRHVDNRDFFTALFNRLTAAYRESATRPQANLWLRAILLELERMDHRTVLTGLAQEQAAMVENFCIAFDEQRSGGMPFPPHYTTDHFARIFKRIKGVSPRDYMLGRRMEQARSLLKNSSLSVSRIADHLGYNDVYFFSKQFKQKTGMTPSEFRKR
jgi:hypothetical protein